MYRIRGRFHFVYVVIDIICLSISYYFYYLWRYNPHPWRYILPSMWTQLRFTGLSNYTAIFIVWCALNLFSLYRSNLFITDRSLSILKETWKVFNALLFASVPTAGAIFMLKFEVYSRLVFISSFITAFVLLSMWRVGKRVYIRHRLEKGLGLIRVLIIGSGPVAESVLDEIKKHPYLGFEVVGILSQERLKGEEIYGVKILGDYSDFEQVVRKYYVDEVFISVNLPHGELERFVVWGRRLGCGIKVVPEGFEYIYGDFNTYNLGYLHFLEYTFKGLHGTDLFIKRFIDVVGSFLLLIIFSPFFIIFPLLIKFSDGGSAFYVSKRVGRKGRIFNFYKFRSMIEGADEMKEVLRDRSVVDGPVFKMVDDPRVTRIGRFMRRWSIDELPQLWNVLKGDMSLVGPRPPTPDEVEKYDLWQLRRLEVKPGITCLWQVRGRSELSFYKWVKWDLWYIDNWSLWLDLKILLWTIPAVLKRRGAY